MRERNSRRASLRHDPALMQQHEAVAAAGLFQNVSGEQNGHAIGCAKLLDVSGEVAARGRVETGGCLVHQQHLRAMQQCLGDFHAAPQAAGKRLHNIAAAVGEPEPFHGALHAVAQVRAAQAVQMPLCAQVLLHSQRLIQALRLEHDADLAAHPGGIPHHVTAGYGSAAFGRGPSWSRESEIGSIFRRRSAPAGRRLRPFALRN